MTAIVVIVIAAVLFSERGSRGIFDQDRVGNRGILRKLTKLAKAQGLLCECNGVLVDLLEVQREREALVPIVLILVCPPICQ